MSWQSRRHGTEPRTIYVTAILSARDGEIVGIDNQTVPLPPDRRDCGGQVTVGNRADVFATMEALDPNEHRQQCEHYLSHALDSGVRLVHAAPLTKSTRTAPWRTNVVVDDVARSYVA